jgi:LmbE family N-acetylglucosaminyl deacetylase
MHKRIIVFSPHPDDETLGCGGTIVKKLGEGYDVYVVLVTDGRHSHDHTFGINDPTPREIKTIRKQEFRNAMRILGVAEKNLILLDFEDGSLEEYVGEAEKKVADILSEIRPAEIYVPFRHDAKKDHEYTFKIVTAGLRKAGISPTIYEYPIWSRKKDATEYHRGEVTLQDIGGVLEIKAKAISAYKSQISKISPKQASPVLEKSFLRIFLQNQEVFYIS